MSFIIDSIRNKLDILNLSKELQSMGMKPVFRVVTQTSYKDTELGTRLLIDTLPISLRAKIDHKDVRYDYVMVSTDSASAALSGGLTLTAPGLGSSVSAIASDIRGTVVGGLKSALTGKDSIDDRSLVGFEVEATVHPGQPYPTLHGIFNVRSSFKSEKTILGEDLIKQGYPIWVYMGYMDKGGNIVAHPFETTKTNNIPLVFGGMIAGMTQDKTNAGTRILIQAVGYNWYLSRFTYRHTASTSSSESGGMFAYVSGDRGKLGRIFERLFDAFHKNGGSKISPLMKKVLRFENEDSSLPLIRYIYGAHSEMLPVNTSNKTDQGNILFMEDGWTFLQAIKELENIYMVDIEWEQNGYLTVHGRDDPLTRIMKHTKSSDERTHNVIVGGNTLNIEHSIDSTGVVNDVEITINNHDSLKSNTFTLDQKFIRAVLTNEYAELFGVKDEAAALSIYNEGVFNIFPGRSISITLTARALDMASEHDIEDDVQENEREYAFLAKYKVDAPIPPISSRLLAEILKRTHFWGMKGSAMIVGNPYIREGDIVQITDISANKGGSMIDFNAVKDVLKSLSDRLETIRTSDKEKLDYLRDRLNPSNGIPSFANIYYIWKVTHYLGENGFWSKIHFVKQRDAPLSSSNIMDMLRGHDNRAKDKRMGGS